MQGFRHPHRSTVEQGLPADMYRTPSRSSGVIFFEAAVPPQSLLVLTLYWYSTATSTLTSRVPVGNQQEQ